MFTEWRKHRGAVQSSVRQETLEELIRTIAVATDSAALRNLVTTRFQAVASCDATWFLEPTTDGSRFVMSWPEQVSTAAVQSDGPLATWLRVNEALLEFPGRTGIATYLAEGERAVLTDLGVRVCVPVFTVGRLRAVILLAVNDRTWSLTPDLALFLMTCSRHAGLAFETIERHEAAVEQVRTAAHTQRLAMAGQFAAMVAHEVRNPLAIIRGAVQLVRDTDPGVDQRRQLLTDAMEEIDRISHTISGFLSLSRPASVQGNVLEILDVLTDAVRIVETYATNRSIAVSTNSTRPSMRVWGDPRELRQVFLNILLNATQAMEGAGTIRIDTSTADEPQADGSGHRTIVVIRIADSGPGIPPDLVDRIFEPFVSTKATGTGLGLAICSQILERHDGRIHLDSSTEAGTTMIVTLPMRLD